MPLQVKNKFLSFIIFVNFDRSEFISRYQKSMSEADLKIVYLVLSFRYFGVDEVGADLFISAGGKSVEVGLGIVPANKSV